MTNPQKFEMVAKTLAGLEQVLAEELKQLGNEIVKIQKRAVVFNGDMESLYKTNYLGRTLLSVLLPVKEFTFESQQEYYEILKAFDWEAYLKPNQTFAIRSVATQSVFSNTHFLSQKTKDALVDHFMEKSGSRPSVDTNNPDILFNVYIFRDKCSLSVDSSGAPLFKRGYRRKAISAPLNEVLAAGLIKLSNWDGDSPFYDPMCGSGTFSIEAAMMAVKMPPQIFRRHFSFMNWRNFDPKLWENIKEKAESEITKQTPEIFASDISNNNMVIARQNLMDAGLLGKVNLSKKDFFLSKPQHETGIMFLNPPYGKRLQSNDLKDFYNKMGTVFKHNYTGFKIWLLSPDDALTYKIGLKPLKKYKVYNGQIECTYLGYEMYRGSKKKKQV